MGEFLDNCNDDEYELYLKSIKSLLYGQSLKAFKCSNPPILLLETQKLFFDMADILKSTKE